MLVVYAYYIGCEPFELLRHLSALTHTFNRIICSCAMIKAKIQLYVQNGYGTMTNQKKNAPSIADPIRIHFVVIKDSCVHCFVTMAARREGSSTAIAHRLSGGNGRTLGTFTEATPSSTLIFIKCSPIAATGHHCDTLLTPKHALLY